MNSSCVRSVSRHQNRWLYKIDVRLTNFSSSVPSISSFFGFSFLWCFLRYLCLFLKKWCRYEHTASSPSVPGQVPVFCNLLYSCCMFITKIVQLFYYVKYLRYVKYLFLWIHNNCITSYRIQIQCKWSPQVAPRPCWNWSSRALIDPVLIFATQRIA